MSSDFHFDVVTGPSNPGRYIGVTGTPHSGKEIRVHLDIEPVPGPRYPSMGTIVSSAVKALPVGTRVETSYSPSTDTILVRIKG